jgi:hypothetical protein
MLADRHAERVGIGGQLRRSRRHPGSVAEGV